MNNWIKRLCTAAFFSGGPDLHTSGALAVSACGPGRQYYTCGGYHFARI